MKIMLGMPQNNEPIKGEAAKRLVKELTNKSRVRVNFLKPFRLGDKMYFDFWILPNIRYTNCYDRQLRISWLFWGINIFFH